MHALSVSVTFTRPRTRTTAPPCSTPTVAALKAKLPALRDALRTPAVFNPFFAWAYEFSCESGQKSITLDIAIGLSQMLLSPDRWPLAETWVEFLKSQTKTVPKDTWRQLLTYMTTVKPDLSNHDDNSASRCCCCCCCGCRGLPDLCQPRIWMPPRAEYPCLAASPLRVSPSTRTLPVPSNAFLPSSAQAPGLRCSTTFATLW